MEKKKRERFGIYIPETVLSDVRQSASRHYVSTSRWILQAILERLAQEKKYE
jgi:metal-responsive CopG/Arc/MetJ family transcriptional regulator